ncbi:hypothetical protein D4R51_02880 [bacterium]|nr:MAG: hypothetical protein D4R51_02880 [bacterium]
MKKFLPIVITALVIGGICFYAGTRIGSNSNKSASQFPGSFQKGSGMVRTGNPQSGGFTGGSVIAKDDKSITVSLRDGSSKIIFVSSSTEIMKSAQGSLGDLSIGEQVTVTGTQNSDGSITAQSVQVRPALPKAN